MSIGIINEITATITEVVNDDERDIYNFISPPWTMEPLTSTEAYNEYAITRYNHYYARFQNHHTAIVCAARSTWAGYLYE